MCIAAAAIPAASLAISAVSTVASIGMGIMQASQASAQAQAQMDQQTRHLEAQARMQQEQQYQQLMQNQQQQQATLNQQRQQTQQNYNLQVTQANQQLRDNYLRQQQEVRDERQRLMDRYEADKVIYQRSKESYEEQTRLNNEAANRVYMGQQAGIQEARTKAAFEAQSILAKSIGAKGSVLAAGRSGQSVGLLVNDVERQAGYATAQESAMAESKVEQGLIQMEGAALKAQSDNAAALSNVAYNPSAPYLPEMPDLPSFIDGSQFSIAS